MPLLFFLLFLRRNNRPGVKALLLYVAISFLNDTILLNIYGTRFDHLTYKILSTYTVVEYSIFAYFLYSVIQSRLFRGIIIASTCGFYLFTVFYFFTSEGKSFDSLSASIESILIIAFCVFYLFDQLNKPQVMFIYQDPGFWFVVGFMVYLSGTLFLFIQASELDKEVRLNFWKINLFANVTKNILFAVAFSVKSTRSIFPSLEEGYDDFLEKQFKA